MQEAERPDFKTNLSFPEKPCQQCFQPMIVLQHASSPAHPEQPPFPSPVSVVTKPAAALLLSPRKPSWSGREAPLELARDEELTKLLEQDPALEDLCKPLSCKLCNVTLNSAQQAQAHYQGKNHSKKLRNYCAANSCPASSRMNNPVEPPAQTVLTLPTPQVGCSRPGGRVIMATENDYCKLCDASFSSPVVAQAHYQGKNHAKRLRLAEAQNNALSDSTEPSKRRVRKEGNEYKMLQNRRNTYTAQSPTGPYFNPHSRQRIPRDLAMCVTPSGQFYCSMCNAGAGEETEFRQHLESKLHKSKVSEQRYRNEMENLGYA
ncbi:zinc finger matrin-type protein 3 isoform X1 [Microcaecilia unicolor]|uniref:Zinc finger matrin-type protein 3 n=2 Tax=Microcaecilia unicolor TaxID=1415580 RepID=A0A6P7Z597_9AMPH|nr:zinc finger matrin-type protein 3 isoform X1 [Microcaecilia unicolor]